MRAKKKKGQRCPITGCQCYTRFPFSYHRTKNRVYPTDNVTAAEKKLALKNVMKKFPGYRKLLKGNRKYLLDQEIQKVLSTRPEYQIAH